MSRLSYKTLFIILFFLLIPIVFLIRINQKSNQVSAAWWDDMWHYRQAINISSHTSTESNVYITTSINISETTKAQTDGGDFRFIDQGGNLLSYYISSGIGTTNIIFHINFNSFPAGAQTLYVYYGNPSAPNGFSVSDFSTAATNYTIGSLDSEEVGGGPVAYWKFDEGVGATAHDSSSNQNNGIITGATWQNEDQCVYGKCLYFNGTSGNNVTIANSKSLQITGNQTISMWLKPTLFGARRNPINKAYGGEGTITLETNATMNYYWGTAGSNASPYQGFNSSNGLKLNEWNHISLVRDITNNKLTWYINGKQSNQTTPSYLQATASSSNIIIGTGYAGSFIGYIDEIKLYPYARSPEQIIQDMQENIYSIKSAKLTEPLIYYKFDEGYGTVAHNSGSTDTNATINNATWTDEGKIKKGIIFNQSNSSYASIDTGFSSINNITISLWFKTGSTNTVIFGQSNNTPPTNPTSFVPTLWIISDGRLRGEIWNGSVGAIYSTSTVNDNNWHYVAIVGNGTTQSLYLDGKHINSRSGTINQSWWTKTTIGSGFPGTRESQANIWNYFNGTIDEVKIYDYALSDDEIKSDYNQSSSVVFSVDKLDIGSTSYSALYCVFGDTSPCSPPIAEWKFDEGLGTTTYDTSGNNNNVSLVNTTWSQGKIGKSLSFNGSSSVLDIPDLSFPGQFTYSFWINNNSTDTRMWFSGSSNQKFGTLGGKFFLRVISSSDNTITFPSLNDWHYITLSRDANNKIDLFIDNNQPIRLFGDVAQSGTTYLSVIGRANDGSGQYYQGKLDQIRIYNYARTPAQIAWDYNQGAPIGWWKFDECQGTTIHDSSNNNNHGTLSIGAGGSQSSVGTCNTSNTAWGTGAAGKLNSSLSFDGTDDYIQIPNIISGDNTHTILFWAKPTSYNKVWIDMSGDSGYSFVQISPTNLYVGYSPITPSYRTYAYTFNLNNWYHIAISKNNTGNNVNVYVNGNLLNVYTGSVGDMNSGSIIYLGKFHNNGYNIGGQLDDARIYNYALTTEQIKQIYNGGAINFN